MGRRAGNASILCDKTILNWTLVIIAQGILGGSVVQNPPANARDVGSIPGRGRPLGEKNGNPLKYSCLEKPLIEEPGRLWSMGSQRIGHYLATKQQ